MLDQPQSFRCCAALDQDCSEPGFGVGRTLRAQGLFGCRHVSLTVGRHSGAQRRRDVRCIGVLSFGCGARELKPDEQRRNQRHPCGDHFVLN